MRLWVLLLITLFVNFSLASVVKRETGDGSEELANEFEEPSAPTKQQGATESKEEHSEATAEHESDDNGEGEHEEHQDEEEGSAQEEAAEDGDAPVENEEDEHTEESPETAGGPEDQDDENAEEHDEDESPAEENVEAEIEEETEEPANEADETEQPAGAEPTEENTETSDSTGEAEVLPAAIASDVPKTEKPAEAAAAQSWVDDFGWTHYPWKKFPITKCRYTHTKDCGCQIKWIKKVYRRRQPKPEVFLAHSSYVKFPRRRCHHHHHFTPVHHHHHTHRPCRRHRHHHHVFHRKPIRTVQHVVVNHAPKPCFKKPIVNYVTKVHHVRAARHNGAVSGFHAHV